MADTKDEALSRLASDVSEDSLYDLLNGRPYSELSYRKENSGLKPEKEVKYKTIEEAEQGLDEGIAKLGGVQYREGAVRMDATTVKDAYALAEGSKQEFSDTIHDLAERLGVAKDDVLERPMLKSFDRTVGKTLDDYGGDIGQVLDINGATFHTDGYAEAEDLFGKAKELLGDSVVKYKKVSTSYGYMDFKVNFKTSNGFIGELIILDRDTAWMKDHGIGHDIYAEGREFVPYLKNRDKYLTLFGEGVYKSIVKLDKSLAEWSTKAYKNAAAIRKGQYDNAGFNANLRAVSSSMTELSNQLRANMETSYPVGSSSITLPSDVGLSTVSSQDSSSLLNGISQISKYLTDIENTSTSNETQTGQAVNGSGMWTVVDSNDGYLMAAENPSTYGKNVDFMRSTASTLVPYTTEQTVGRIKVERPVDSADIRTLLATDTSMTDYQRSVLERELNAQEWTMRRASSRRCRSWTAGTGTSGYIVGLWKGFASIQNNARFRVA